MEDIFEGEGKLRGEESFDIDKLRKYELEKMQYFYAIVTCDSVKTANHLYQECDGMELELSGCKIDLRFVPDSIEKFPYKPRDSCKEIPEMYLTKAGILNRTMNHTRVELTWEREKVEPEKELKKKKLLNKKLEEFDSDD